MAAFLVRALGYTDNGGGDLFSDDNSSTFETDINKLGTAGVTRGCNPPTNDQFCPDDLVTRGQMAAFLVRALGYTDDGGGDLFVDDDGSTFEADIDKLGTAGVTRGCNPPASSQWPNAAAVWRLVECSVGGFEPRDDQATCRTLKLVFLDPVPDER